MTCRGRNRGRSFPRLSSAPQGRPKWRAQVIANFMFCTGIENSIPTINNGKTRIDQMEACDHYRRWRRSEEHTSELQSLMRISYAVFCLQTKHTNHILTHI